MPSDGLKKIEGTSASRITGVQATDYPNIPWYLVMASDL